MDQYILAKYDVSGIQSYIFASNRLRENVGASNNVGRILKEMLPEALKEWAADGFGKVLVDWEKAEGGKFQMADNPELLAEVLYIGGGNALVVYKNETCCNQVSRRFAIKITEQCQGVTVLTSSVKVQLEDFPGDIRLLNQKMGEIKKRVRRQLPVSSYPIVEQDSADGFPVTRQELRNGTAFVMSGIRYEKCAADIGSNDEDARWRYAREMEELAAQKGEDSYVAVIHIDGNGMGGMVQKIMNENRTYEAAVPAMRQFSAGIAGRYTEAKEAMTAAFETVFGENLLPLRPLISDGDDMTFLCCARVGIPASVFYLRKLLKLSDENLPLSACAGIAFVHNHFPFNIAYEIAEECCSRAKRRWYQEDNGNHTAGYLDFEVVQGAYVKGMKSASREEKVRIRPFRVGAYEELPGTDSVDHLFGILKRMIGDKGKTGVWPMNRLRHLCEAYRAGGSEMEFLKREYASRGYELSKLSGISGKGACAEEAGIFDALEIMDFYEGGIWTGFWSAFERGGSL